VIGRIISRWIASPWTPNARSPHRPAHREGALCSPCGLPGPATPYRHLDRRDRADHSGGWLWSAARGCGGV